MGLIRPFVYCSFVGTCTQTTRLGCSLRPEKPRVARYRRRGGKGVRAWTLAPLTDQIQACSPASSHAVRRRCLIGSQGFARRTFWRCTSVSRFAFACRNLYPPVRFSFLCRRGLVRSLLGPLQVGSSRWGFRTRVLGVRRLLRWPRLIGQKNNMRLYTCVRVHGVYVHV